MNEETLNLSIRKFLKVVGVSSQHELERAIEKAIAAGSIAGTETLVASMTLRVDALQVNIKFDGDIKLE